jgi:futalosine hydrolase
MSVPESKSGEWPDSHHRTTAGDPWLQNDSDICKMHFLITAATAFEIQPAIDFFQANRMKNYPYDISFLITGIGGVATAYSLTKEISRSRPHFILQAGIAGCFTNHALAETLLVREDFFADLGVHETDGYKNIFELGLAGKDNFPFSNGWLINPNEKLLNHLPLEKVKGVTVNEIATGNEKIEWYRQIYNAVVESMEGAAFHYVCLRESIPFLQIRSISNYAGERDKTKWKLNEAIEALNEKLILITAEIVKQDEV